MPENMSKEELRRAHRDARQREMMRRRRIFYGLMIVLVFGIGLILSFTVFFNVSKIEVRGYSIYSNDEIISYSKVKKGDNLFLINKSKVTEHIVENLAYIGDVDVKVSLPNKLVLTVYETSVKTAIKNSDCYVLLNEDGKVLAKVTDLDEVYANAVLEGGEAYVSEEETTTAQTTEETTTAQTTEETTTAATEETTTEAESTDATSTPIYVLEDKDFILLKGVKVKHAIPGSIIEFKSDKALEIYTQIMDLFIENDVTGITELDLTDLYNIVMRYEDRIDVKVGSITNLDKKMAFAAEVIKDQDALGENQEGVIDATLDDKAYFSPTTATTKATTTESTSEGETKEGETTTSSKDKTTTTTKKSSN